MIEEYNHGKEFPTLKSLPNLRFRRRADPRESSESAALSVSMTMCCMFSLFTLICGAEYYLSPVVFIRREVRGQFLELRGVRVSIRDAPAGLDHVTLT